jgi:hypothetical protein
MLVVLSELVLEGAHQRKGTGPVLLQEAFLSFLRTA